MILLSPEYTKQDLGSEINKCALYRAYRTIHRFNLMNYDLENLSNRLRRHELKLNPNKSFALCDKRCDSSLDFQLNGQSLPKTKCTQKSGIYIDENI